MQLSPWNSLEIVKLLVSALTPIAVAILGVYLTRLAKRFEYLQWRNQRLIEKRIAVYDDLAPELNDLLCYFCFVGSWKDLTPPQVVAMKRDIDKRIYLASPLFPSDFHDACMKFMGLCFATFQGWGVDAKLRTPPDRRKEASGSKWESQWDDCFSTELSEIREVRSAYQEIMAVFSREIGLNPGVPQQPLGKYPANTRRWPA